MKLIRMHADDFGGLHNYDYTFEDGLNVILHDNGWGKTTMAAFLKAMLYGFDSKRSKDITENERKRYLPWQGGKYGGSLDFEAEGVKYRIFRTFGETPRFDRAKILNLDTHTTARIDPEKIGETLFKLDASAFQRSVFINQNGLSIDGAASSIHTRLNALVSQANDVAAFDDAIAKLTAQIKVYEKTGARGQIGDITRQIAALEKKRDELERDIAEQDNARERILQIDILLNSINENLEAKKKKLEEVSGEARKREAAKKFLEDLNKQIAELQQQMDLIKTDLGGRIPNTAEIEQVKHQKQAVATLTQQLTELVQNYNKLVMDYNDLLEKYNHSLPTTAQLDEIQGIYGELQGIQSTGIETAESSEEAPEGYTIIKEVVDSNSEFVDRLTITVGTQMTLQQYIRKLESAERDVADEQEDWCEKKKRYASYASEVDRLRGELEGVKDYTSEAVDSVLSGLEDLQKKQRTLNQQITDQTAAIQREKESWAEKKQRYSAYAAEVSKLQADVNKRAGYRPEAVEPVISELEAQQKQQRTLTQQCADQTAAITREADSWSKRKQRFSKLSLEVERLQEEYNTVQAYHPEAVTPVVAALEMQQKMQRTLMQQEEDQVTAVMHASEDWAEKKKKYAALKEEADRLEVETQSRSKYEPSAVRPAIASLEEIRKQQQLVDVRQEELATDGLTAEQEALLEQYPGDLPDVAEANAVLKKLRGITQKKSDAQGISAKLAGEQSRVASLKASIDQIGDVTEDAPVEEPKRPSGTAQICVGAAIVVIGVVLSFAISPFVAVVAIIGAVFAVTGVVGNSRYKEKQRAYETYKASVAQKQDRRNKKAELQKQLDAALASASALQKQINELNEVIATDQSGIDAWAKKWAAGSELTEVMVLEIIENTEQVVKLRKKKQAISDKEAFVKAKTAYIAAERGKVDGNYPELNGLGVGDALERLRSAETDARLYDSQLQSAKNNLEKFFAEAGLNAGDLSAGESPALADMQTKIESICRELTKIEAGRKALNGTYPEITDMSYDDALRTLRAKASDYKFVSGQLQTAREDFVSFLTETKLSAEQFYAEESPAIAAMQEKLARIRSELEQLENSRKALDENYPEISGLSYDEALKLLRAKAGEYKVAASQLQTAIRNEAASVSDAKVDAAQLEADESPVIAGMQAKLDAANAELERNAQRRAQYDQAFREIEGMTIEDAVKYLRGRESNYRVVNGQLQTALRNLQKYLTDAKYTAEQFTAAESPRIAEFVEARDEAAQNLAKAMTDANDVLMLLDMNTDTAHILQALREAGELLNEYKQYAEKLKDRAGIQAKKQQRMEELQDKLEGKLPALQGRYPDLEVPERLALIRKEIGQAATLKAKIAESENDQRKQQERISTAEKLVESFKTTFGRFASKTDDVLTEIYTKASTYCELSASVQQLEKQKATADSAHYVANAASDAEETTIRSEIAHIEERRDALRDEYTHKSDFIRQADQSLERYPDVISEIHTLYDQKQKAQNTLAMLKRTIQLITKAKENLANRYLSKVERLFNDYMHIWLNNDAVKGILDVDFNITIKENDKIHVAEGYSTGYCDLIDFCMRLALVDTLFENEQPFLILDDPFVNLDVDRLEKALELLNVMAANKQIVYFVCHPIRAVEANENSSSRTEFAELAEATRKTIAEHKTSGIEHKKAVRKSPKEMYQVINTGSTVAIKPEKPNYTITNNIFSMNFILNDEGIVKDHSYELFFIDAIGHVLNERQLIEIKDGKLSAERVQFCLNTRDDSGDQYELMIRESGQGDYEVVARIPFRARLAFTGTFSFDF